MALVSHRYHGSLAALPEPMTRALPACGLIGIVMVAVCLATIARARHRFSTHVSNLSALSAGD
jgi:hypothetical protein